MLASRSGRRLAAAVAALAAALAVSAPAQAAPTAVERSAATTGYSFGAYVQELEFHFVRGV